MIMFLLLRENRMRATVVLLLLSTKEKVTKIYWKTAQYTVVSLV